jgi:hypothetical protein
LDEFVVVVNIALRHSSMRPLVMTEDEFFEQYVPAKNFNNVNPDLLPKKKTANIEKTSDITSFLHNLENEIWWHKSQYYLSDPIPYVVQYVKKSEADSMDRSFAWTNKAMEAPEDSIVAIVDSVHFKYKSGIPIIMTKDEFLEQHVPAKTLDNVNPDLLPKAWSRDILKSFY